MMRDGSTSLKRLRTLCRSPETWGYLAVLVLLAVSVPAYKLIPGLGKQWGPTPDDSWGLDLQNLFTFHHCGRGLDPYASTGRACGDWIGRGMLYPPLLYWSFAWTRLFSFPTARLIWTAFIGLVLAGSTVFWGRARDPLVALPVRARVALVGALLIVGFPGTFSVERGNNDVLVILVWSGSLALFLRGRRGLAGGLAGLAVALKLYPAFAAAVVCAGLLGSMVRRGPRAAALRFGAGLALVPAALSLALFSETRTYFTKVLPGFAAHLPAVTVYSHSIPATFRNAPRPVSAALVLAWAAAAFFRLEDAPREVFAGALAISTYVAATSFDYNLVTAYPLLLVLLLRAFEQEQRRAVWDWAAFVLGLVAVAAHRAWFTRSPTAHVALQLGWLSASALLVGVAGAAVPRREDAAKSASL
jgi:hypothetical protein